MLLIKHLFSFFVSFLTFKDIFFALLMSLKTKLSMFLFLLFLFLFFEIFEIFLIFFNSHLDFIPELLLFFVDLSDFIEIFFCEFWFNFGSFKKMSRGCAVLECWSTHFDWAFHELNLMKLIKNCFLFLLDLIELLIHFREF